MKKISKKSTRESSGTRSGSELDNAPPLAPGSSTKTTLRDFSTRVKKSAGAAADTMKKQMSHSNNEGSHMDGNSVYASSSSMRQLGASSNQPFETSEGAMRLNRILDQNNSSSSRRDSATGATRHKINTGVTASPVTNHANLERNASADSGGGLGMNNPPNPTSPQRRATSAELDYIPPSTVQLADPTDENAVGEMTCRISSKQRVDSRSIGGMIVAGDGKVEARTGNVLLREGWEEQLTESSAVDTGGGDDGDDKKQSSAITSMRPINRLTNESLFSMCVSQFDLSVGLSGGPSGGKKRHIPIAKTRNKLRYVVILRSTNRPLLRPRSGRTGVDGTGVGVEALDDDMRENDDDLGSDDGYDHMYNPDPNEAGSSKSKKKKKKSLRKKGGDDSDDGAGGRKTKASKLYEEYDCGIPQEREISSFPALLCLAIHADGTKPDVRKVLELDKLVSIENSPPRKNAALGSAGHVVLVFRNGDAVEIDCDLPNAVMHATGVGAVGGGAAGATASVSEGKNSNTAIDAANKLRKERFLWSLLQVHAILCTAVVERTAAAAALARPGSAMATSQLPPLVVRNVDRGELQYISTVKGFLTESPVLCALLDRQSTQRRGMLTGTNSDEKKAAGNTEEGKSGEMDGIAYDMMMGNYNRVALFVNEEEKQDAADVLNNTPWQQQEINSDGMTNVDASATADTLMRMLQQRMRDLEAETCRRLISWEDEKYFSATGERPEGGVDVRGEKGTVDAMSLNDLFTTLQSLDDELEKMESWIQDRATMIKPITDECHGIEEENRMLEQQWVSYETLGKELKRLLGGLALPENLTEVLERPGSVIVYDNSGAIDVNASEDGVELIHQAGQALKLAIDTAEGEGGIHLRAVSDTLKGLSATSSKFCGALARIVVTVMEQLAREERSRSDVTIGKGDNHSSIAKKIREVRLVLMMLLVSQIIPSHDNIACVLSNLDTTKVSGITSIIHQDHRNTGSS